MSRLTSAMATALLLAGAVARADDGDPHRVAVLDIVSPDVQGPQILELPDFIAAVITSRTGFAIASSEDTHRAISQRDTARPGCLVDDDCRLDLGRDLHAGFVVAGTFEKQGSEYVLQLDLLSTSGNPAKHATERMKKLKSLEQNVEPCLKQLFGWSSAPKAMSAPAPIDEAPQAFVAAPMIDSVPEVPQRKRVMVMPIVASGIDRAVVAPLANVVAQEVGKHTEYDVASTDDIRSLSGFQEAKRMTGCAEDAACITELSRKVAADMVVRGTLGKVGREFVLTLALVDAATVGELKRAQRTAPRIEDIQGQVRGCVESLFGVAETPSVAPKSGRGKKTSYAVFDLKPTGLSAQIAQNLTQVLSTEVKSVDGATVVSREDIEAMLQIDKAKMQAGCDDDGCMAAIGGALGVDRLVTGDAGKVGARYLVNLRLIDVRAGKVEGRVTESFQGDEEQLLHAVRKAARDLLGIAPKANGSIAITTSERGARVYLDREKEGAAPVLVTNVEPGKHIVTVAATGFFDWRGDAYVDPLETTNVWTQLKERPLPWYEQWWVWTIVGGVVAGSAGAAAGVALNHPPTSGTISVKLGSGAMP